MAPTILPLPVEGQYKAAAYADLGPCWFCVADLEVDHPNQAEFIIPAQRLAGVPGPIRSLEQCIEELGGVPTTGFMALFIPTDPRLSSDAWERVPTCPWCFESEYREAVKEAEITFREGLNLI